MGRRCGFVKPIPALGMKERDDFLKSGTVFSVSGSNSTSVARRAALNARMMRKGNKCHRDDPWGGDPQNGRKLRTFITNLLPLNAVG
jgi:hypothetical protein